MQNDVGCLISLDTLPRVVEELVQGRALTLLECVVVEDPAKGELVAELDDLKINI